MIDLHTHSTVSDGSDAPGRIADLAAAAGCEAFALTDHDRMDGWEEAGRRAAVLEVGFVPGCELSCVVPSGAMHVLVYWAKRNSPLEGALARVQQARTTRNQRMLEKLRDLGIDVSQEELEDEAGQTGVGRPHFAAILVRKGHAASIQDAFDRFLARGRPAYVERERMTPANALQLSTASGGVPVLAHPLSLGLSAHDLDRRVDELTELGLAGLEAVYGRYDAGERAALSDLAARHDLVATGGSDHHGTYKPDLRVGVGRGDLDVPAEVLEALAARRPD